MNKNLEIIIVFLVALVLISFPSKDIGFSGLARIYRFVFPVQYRGVVKDESRGWNLQGAEIKLGEEVTYTDKDGRFFIEEDSFNNNGIKFNPPYNFQTDGAFQKCTKVSARLVIFGSFITCEAGFYPKPFEVARRIIQTEDTYLSSDEKGIKENLITIWGLLAKSAQADWGSQEIFVKDLTVKFLIDDHFSKSAAGSYVTAEGNSFTRPELSFKVDPKDQYFTVPVERNLKDKTAVRYDMFFIKEGYSWRWLPSFTRKEIGSYINGNSTVLQ